MNRSRYLSWQQSRLGRWLLAAACGVQGAVLADKWKVDPLVFVVVGVVPFFLMLLGRLAERLGFWVTIGATAHLLLTALTIDHLVRTDRPSWAQFLLLLLLAPGVAFAIGAIVNRLRRPAPGSESADSVSAGQSPSKEPIE